MADVVSDIDLAAPQPFQVLRSTGQWVAGKFQSTITSTLELVGPVQQATDKEAAMLPEGDRVGQVFSFWATVPLYTTRGKMQATTLHEETPAGARPGTTFTLSTAPQGQIVLFLNGAFLTPGIDYTLTGTAITMNTVVSAAGVFKAQWPVETATATAAADILVYNGEQYRLLDVKHYPGGGYWKALATRMSAT